MRSIFLVLIAFVVTACDSSPPAISDIGLERNPNPTVPLAAILTVATDEPAALTISIDDGERQWSMTPSDEMSAMHEVPIFGMRAGRDNTITATLTDAKGNAMTSGPLMFATPPLPEAFPTPRVTVRNADAMEPGVTLFNVNGRWGPDGKATPANFAPAIIVDDEGEIIWYYFPDGHKVHDIRRMPNGNFIYEIWPDTGGMVEIDMLRFITISSSFPTGTSCY